jgi:hypothetical protein
LIRQNNGPVDSGTAAAMSEDDTGLVMVRIPRQTMLAFAAALDVGVWVESTDAKGVTWYWPMGGAEHEERVEIAVQEQDNEVCCACRPTATELWRA